MRGVSEGIHTIRHFFNNSVVKGHSADFGQINVIDKADRFIRCRFGGTFVLPADTDIIHRFCSRRQCDCGLTIRVGFTADSRQRHIIAFILRPLNIQTGLTDRVTVAVHQLCGVGKGVHTVSNFFRHITVEGNCTDFGGGQFKDKAGQLIRIHFGGTCVLRTDADIIHGFFGGSQSDRCFTGGIRFTGCGRQSNIRPFILAPVHHQIGLTNRVPVAVHQLRGIGKEADTIRHFLYHIAFQSHGTDFG